MHCADCHSAYGQASNWRYATLRACGNPHHRRPCLHSYVRRFHSHCLWNCPPFSLIIIHYFFTFLNRKSVYFRTFLNGKPVIIIDEDGIDYEALKKLNMTLNDLNEGLRACDCFNIADVAYAIVETNGNVSVLLKSLASPATKEDLKLSIKDVSLNVILINDGKIMKENLKCLNLTESFLLKIAKEQKTKSISDILIFSINQNGEIFYQEKYKSCKTIFKKGEK